MQKTPRRFFRRSFPSIVCTTFLAVSLFGCGGGSGDSKGRIVGTVYDGDPAQESRTAAGIKVYVVRSASNTEIPNFVVIAESASDQSGRFAISVPPGEYSVYAANGYGFFGPTTMLCTVFGNPIVREGQDSTVTLGYIACSGAVP